MFYYYYYYLHVVLVEIFLFIYSNPFNKSFLYYANVSITLYILVQRGVCVKENENR